MSRATAKAGETSKKSDPERGNVLVVDDEAGVRELLEEKLRREGLDVPEVSLGIIPGFGGTQRLPRLIGPGRAKEMVMSGDMVGAAKALDWGLVNDVVPPEELMDAAKAMAKRFMKNGPVAVGLGKAAVDNGIGLDLKRALFLEAELEATAFSTEDRHEGMNAFVEKRKPDFKGQ